MITKIPLSKWTRRDFKIAHNRLSRTNNEFQEILRRAKESRSEEEKEAVGLLLNPKTR